MTDRKLGRPRNNESRDKMSTIVFKADDATRRALERLHAHQPHRALAAIIREALLEKAARLG